jgi:hypothetical protein
MRAGCHQATLMQQRVSPAPAARWARPRSRRTLNSKPTNGQQVGDRVLQNQIPPLVDPEAGAVPESPPDESAPAEGILRDPAPKNRCLRSFEGEIGTPWCLYFNPWPMAGGRSLDTCGFGEGHRTLAAKFGHFGMLRLAWSV